MLPVFSKYKKYMENGTRLENLSWRLWHQKQKFVPPNLSLSAGKPCHEVSQKKQTQHDQVLNEKHNMIEYPSTSTTPTTTATTNNNNNNSRTTTPSLTDSYQHGDEDYDEDEDEDYLYDEEDDDDDYLYDDEDDYLYDDEDEDDYYDEEEELRKLKEAIRLHKEKKLNQYSFEKTPPRPLTQQPSLLSALFKTPPSSNSSSTTTTSSSSTSTSSTDLNQQTYRSHHHHPSYPSLVPTSTATNNNNNKDALFKEELTESLRNNVLWEHLQQKSIMYTKRNQRSYYRHPSHTTSTTITTTMNPSLPTQHYHHPSQYRSLYNHNTNTNTNNTNSSDHGWLEHFHGW
ncbi:unnamed protein product [Cunninghamella echinulata]